MNIQNEQMADLLDTLRDCVSGYEDNNETHLYVDRFISIYQHDDFRHLYNMLSQFLERELTADQRDYLPIVIENAMEEITRRIENPVNSEIVPDKLEMINDKLSKLLDHVILEGIRLNRMEAVQRISDKTSQALQRITEQGQRNEEISQNINALDEKVNSFNAQSITILSIFAGLVLVFSSGIELLSETFSNLNDMNCFKICIYLLVIGMILFNVVFLLLYVVAKISCTDISISLSKTKKPSKIFLSRLHQRYPYVFWFNVVCVVIILLLLTAIYFISPP